MRYMRGFFAVIGGLCLSGFNYRAYGALPTGRGGILK